MIQDIAPHQFHNEYRPVAPKKDDIILCYDGRKILLRLQDEEVGYPRFEEIETLDEIDVKSLYQQYVYLFEVDSVHFYLCTHKEKLVDWAEKLSKNSKSYEWADISKLRNRSPKYLSFAGVTGWQLYQWYDSRRFCGRCGHPMVPDEKERMMKCPECGLMEFPKICPAVIIAVTHGNRILLSKYAGRAYKKYALLAGFTEIGETLEETVQREVMEEVGLKVKNITYYKCQPWSFTDTLLTGFYCELDGEEAVVLDEEELALAEWFEKDEIPVEEEDCSLTNEMIMNFKRGKSPFNK